MLATVKTYALRLILMLVIVKTYAVWLILMLVIVKTYSVWLILMLVIMNTYAVTLILMLFIVKTHAIRLILMLDHGKQLQLSWNLVGSEWTDLLCKIIPLFHWHKTHHYPCKRRYLTRTAQAQDWILLSLENMKPITSYVMWCSWGKHNHYIIMWYTMSLLSHQNQSKNAKN